MVRRFPSHIRARLCKQARMVYSFPPWKDRVSQYTTTHTRPPTIDCRLSAFIHTTSTQTKSPWKGSGTRGSLTLGPLPTDTSVSCFPTGKACTTDTGEDASATVRARSFSLTATPTKASLETESKKFTSKVVALGRPLSPLRVASRSRCTVRPSGVLPYGRPTAISLASRQQVPLYRVALARAVLPSS